MLGELRTRGLGQRRQRHIPLGRRCVFGRKLLWKMHRNGVSEVHDTDQSGRPDPRLSRRTQALAWLRGRSRRRCFHRTEEICGSRIGLWNGQQAHSGPCHRLHRTRETAAISRGVARLRPLDCSTPGLPIGWRIIINVIASSTCDDLPAVAVWRRRKPSSAPCVAFSRRPPQRSSAVALHQASRHQ
jgi:hypothetical protein